MLKSFDWKMFFILLVAAMVGLLAVIPYTLALQGSGALDQAAAAAKMPVWQILAIQLGSNIVLFAVAIAIGLSFAKSIGLGLPILDARLRGEAVGHKLRSILPISIILGVLSALLILALDAFVFQPALKAEFGAVAANLSAGATTRPTWWQGLLASFYGGIDEEILLRLCVMSFLAWLGRFISKTPEGKPTLAVFWIANILAAVLFGLGHLPMTSVLVPLTPLIVLRAIVLNGLAGVAFGYLYFTRGLESAMLSHFSADIVLHVLFAI